MHEVVLQVNLEAKAGDKVVWLLELQQAGAFLIRNLSAARPGPGAVSIVAPNYLMAFARATVSDLVTKGGFPPFLLPLVTFEALHARAQQQPAAGAARRRPAPSTDAARRRDGPAGSPGRSRPSPCSARARGARRSPCTSRAPGHRAILWGIETDELTAMARDRVNDRYLPGVDPARRASRSSTTLRAPWRRPTSCWWSCRATRSARCSSAPGRCCGPASASPGPPRASSSRRGKLPHEVAAEVLGPGVPTAVLSGPTFAKEVGAGLPSAMTVASRDGDYAMAARAQHLRREFPRLCLERHDRRRGRRRGQERARHRRRHFRRPRLRREHARRADHARPRGDDAPRRRARRRPRHVHGARRPRRPRAHLHRRPVAQPPLRPAARGRQDAASRRRRRSARWSRACSPRAPCTTSRGATASRCRSASRSTACSTKARRRRTPCTR